MSKELLIEMAKSMINDGFMEESLKADAHRYIEYKFNDLIYFAKITDMHFEIFRENKDEIQRIKAMTIIELIILASDIMDDLQDKDAHDAPWSNVDDAFNLNIIVGILLICLKEIDEIGCGVDKQWIHQNVFEPLLKSISGQQIDLKNELMTENDYLQMCYLKSGSLIGLACFLGAGKVHSETREKIEEYANYLGVIFQLRNDVADMEAGFVKNDLLLKKRTLPIIYHLNIDDQASSAIQDYYLNRSSNSDETLIHQNLMSGDALLYCSVVENVFSHKYKRVIDQLDLSMENKQLLLTIISKF